MRTRVKICGITRPQDAVAAAGCGADAIGLVFYPDSPRHVSLAQARRIARMVAPFVTVTGLFVNAGEDLVREVLDAVPLGLLQFHGQENNADCRRYGKPFIKAIAMRDTTDLQACLADYPDAAGFLLDAWQPRAHGGGGERFNWNLVPANLPYPVILAGGLNPGNVAEAINRVRPYAVDVSSGVEREKGIKSAEKISAFMKGVQQGGTDEVS
ncbi:MAG: phosphoribosylanthranilate isomerase [Gammaproteobacteria bacterium]|jgi:phosphoribosylanthranilate isomerase